MDFDSGKIIRFLIICFTLNLTPINYGVNSQSNSPFENQPTITIKDGHLIFETGKDKNMTFRASTGGAINVNNQNLGKLVNDATTATNDIKSITSSHVGGIRDTVGQMEQQISNLTAATDGLNTIQENVNKLKSKVDDILGTGEGALTPRRIRRAVQQINKLQTDFNNLKKRVTTNECASNPCKNGGTCMDGYGTFHCRCPTQWQGFTCEEDVNECELYKGTDIGCQNGATCINTVGSYSCQCTNDWKGVHCTQKQDDCFNSSVTELCDHGSCVNIKRKSGTPSYMCFCDPGWKTDGVNPACSIDVNECEENSQPPCSLNPPVPCVNTPGSFYCADCPEGFTGNGKICKDVDECKTNNGGCSQYPKVACRNTIGSRICDPCPAGYIGDGVTCTSTNCKIDNGGCFANATCSELEAVISCTCPSGYDGDGVGPSGCIMRVTTTNSTISNSTTTTKKPK